MAAVLAADPSRVSLGRSVRGPRGPLLEGSGRGGVGRPPPPPFSLFGEAPPPPRLLLRPGASAAKTDRAGCLARAPLSGAQQPSRGSAAARGGGGSPS
jgi:hypothetical protein